MAYYDDEIYPVTRITTGAVGEAGQRVFILQAQVDGQTVSWVIEKEHVVALSRSIPRLLTDVRSEFPELAEPVVAAKPNLQLNEPLEPEFRVGGLGLGYDRIHDLVVLTLVDAEEEEEEAAEEEQPPEDLEEVDDEIRVYTTRGQAWLLSQQSEVVVAAGRPYCPDCGEPMDDFGHFCLPPYARIRRGGEIIQ